MRVETVMTPDGGVVATLYNGDCKEVLPTLPDDSVRLLWTDPPYGHGNHDGDLNASLNELRGLPNKPIANDEPLTMREIVDFMLREATRILKKDSCCCCCCCGGGGPRPTFAWLANRMDSDGMSFFHSVIWDKRNPGLGMRYRREHEMIMVAHLTDGKLAWNVNQAPQPNIIDIGPPRDRMHPNQKPLELVEFFILNHTLPESERDDIVLDPFMGSGTTGVAALRMGRRFIGVELDPYYFNVALKRLQAAVVDASARLLAFA